MKLLKIILTALLVLRTGAIPAYSQGTNYVKPVLALDEQVVSPQAEPWTFPVYEEPQVDLSTGSGTMAVNLFSWNVGNFPMSLSLGYAIGGHTVDEKSGLIGLGWQLNCAGTIYRDIIGLPDEKKEFETLGSTEIYDLEYPDGDYSKPTGKGMAYLDKLENRTIEASYDRYHYSIPGHTGSFIMKNGNPVKLTPDNLSITTEGNERDGVKDFLITLPDGTRYEFTEREKISYKYTPWSTPMPFVSPNYQNTVAKWHLSRIITPQGCDTISYNYEELPMWGVSRGHNTQSVGITITGNTYEYNNGAVSYSLTSTSNIQTWEGKLLKTITSRTATVEFSHSSRVDKEAELKFISGLTVRNQKGDEVRTVSFSQSGLGDGRRVLRGLTVKSGGTLLDSLRFTYAAFSFKRPGDFFNYANGFNTVGNSGVIDANTALFNDRRKPKAAYAAHGAMTQYTNAYGLTVSFAYEPNQMNRGDGKEPLQIGIRLKFISASDAATGRKRTRSFSYSEPVCNIDFSQVNRSAFVSLSGLSYIKTNGVLYAEPCRSLSAALPETSRTPGYAPESAKIYYGAATEDVSGTGIDVPVRTEYRFDTSRCILTYMPDGNSFTSSQYFLQYGLGNIYTTSTRRENVETLIRTGIACGYFAECNYAVPVLRLKRDMKYENGKYVPLHETEYFHSLIDSAAHVTGTFHEPLTGDLRAENTGAIRRTYASIWDFNFYQTIAFSGQWQLDSVAERHFYGKNESLVTTAYRYTKNLWTQRNVPTTLSNNASFSPDSLIAIPYPLGHTSIFGDTVMLFNKYHLLTSTVVRSKGHKYEHHIAYSGMCTSRFFSSLQSDGVHSLPVAQMWIADGRDTLLRRDEYGMFHRLARPVRISLGIKGGPEITSRRFTAYTSLGFPLDCLQPGMPDTKYSYVDNLLNSISTGPDDDCHSRWFSHIPLVGCTSISRPSGASELYDYEGGRLVRHRAGPDGPLLEEYSYSTATKDVPAHITVTSHAAGLPAVTRDFYDGYGLSAGTVRKDFGSSGMVAEVVRRDALDRPLKTWSPLPVGDTGSIWKNDSPLSTAATDAYGDNAAYSSCSYPLSAYGAPESTTLAGSEFAGHPSHSAEVCSDPTMPELKVRRLRWNGSTLRCAGYYTAGELHGIKETDADGVCVITLCDLFDRPVLRRAVCPGGIYADSHYVYDSWGNPLLVLQPEGSALLVDRKQWTESSDLLQEYAFIYKYNAKMRVISRKEPGCEAVLTAYDPQGRIVSVRDGQLAAKGQRRFYLYDPHGRVAASGVCPDFTDNREWTSEQPETTVARPGNRWMSYRNRYDIPADLLPDGAVIDDTRYYDAMLPTEQQHPEVIGNPLSTHQGMLMQHDVAALHGGIPTGTVTRKYWYNHRDQMTNGSVTMPGGAVYSVLTQYNPGGMPEIEYHSLTGGPDGNHTLLVKTEYDSFGRTQRVTASCDGADSLLLEKNVYGASGMLESTEIEDNIVTRFTHNARGALTKSANRFLEQTWRYASDNTPSYAGRISGKTEVYLERIRKLTPGPVEPSPIDTLLPIPLNSAPLSISSVDRYISSSRHTEYTYDSAGRLAHADSHGSFSYGPWPQPSLQASVPITIRTRNNAETFTHDLNGNILTTVRKGQTSPNVYGTVDSLVITYDGNRMASLEDAAGNVLLESSMDIPAGHYSGTDFRYDAAGCLTRDMSRGISHIDYHMPGIPAKIETADGDSIVFEYTADGVKLSETVYRDGIPSRREYIGPWEFIDGKLARVNLEQGYVTPDGALHAYVRDTQGNIAGVFLASDNSGKLEQHNEYYAYGGLMASSKGADRNRRKHTAKELVSDLGINTYDFSARFLYPMGMRFDSPDRLASNYPWLSPYIMCAADPINFSDPTGMIIEVIASGNDGGVFQWRNVDNKWGFYNSSGKLYSGTDEFVNSLNDALSTLMKGNNGYTLVKEIANDARCIEVQRSNRSGIIDEHRIGWNYTGLYKGNSEYVNTQEGIDISPFINLGHELGHIRYNWNGGEYKEWLTVETPIGNKSINVSEIDATHIENLLRAEHRLPLRTYYIKTLPNTYRWDHRDKLIDPKTGTSKFVDSFGNINHKPLKKGTNPYKY